MNISKREGLNNIVLLLVLFLALKIDDILPNIEKNSFFILISLVTAKGLYEISIKLLFLFIENNNFLMKIYWGDLYLSGYWSYEYTRADKVYYGIWRFEQNLNEIHVVGSGLDDNFLPRTIVNSVSPLIKDQASYYLLNVRTELGENNKKMRPVYSKTTLILDKTKGLFSPVVTMRATTEIFGGASNGHIHPNVIFKKHLEANSDEDVIMQLKEKYTKIKHRQVKY